MRVGMTIALWAIGLSLVFGTLTLWTFDAALDQLRINEIVRTTYLNSVYPHSDGAP